MEWCIALCESERQGSGAEELVEKGIVLLTRQRLVGLCQCKIVVATVLLSIHVGMLFARKTGQKILSSNSRFRGKITWP